MTAALSTHPLFPLIHRRIILTHSFIVPFSHQYKQSPQPSMPFVSNIVTNKEGTRQEGMQWIQIFILDTLRTFPSCNVYRACFQRKASCDQVAPPSLPIPNMNQVEFYRLCLLSCSKYYWSWTATRKECAVRSRTLFNQRSDLLSMPLSWHWQVWTPSSGVQHLVCWLQFWHTKINMLTQNYGVQQSVCWPKTLIYRNQHADPKILVYNNQQADPKLWCTTISMSTQHSDVQQ